MKFLKRIKSKRKSVGGSVKSTGGSARGSVGGAVATRVEPAQEQRNEDAEPRTVATELSGGDEGSQPEEREGGPEHRSETEGSKSTLSVTSSKSSPSESRAPSPAGSWSYSDLLRGPSSASGEGEGGAQKEQRRKLGTVAIQQTLGWEERDLASLITRVVRCGTYPRAVNETRDAAALDAQRSGGRLTAHEKERALRKAKMEAEMEARRAQEKEQRKVGACKEKMSAMEAEYAEKLKLMEASLSAESKQNAELNKEVKQLKENLSTAAMVEQEKAVMMEANLNAESAKSCSLSEKVGLLKQAIIAATNQLETEQATAAAAQEAQQANEAKVADLERQLRVAMKKEAAIQKAQSEVNQVQEKYDKEADAVRALREELAETRAGMARVRRQKTRLREREAAAVVHIQALQAQADGLAEQLKEADNQRGCCVFAQTYSMFEECIFPSTAFWDEESKASENDALRSKSEGIAIAFDDRVAPGGSVCSSLASTIADDASGSSSHSKDAPAVELKQDSNSKEAPPTELKQDSNSKDAPSAELNQDGVEVVTSDAVSALTEVVVQ